SVQNKVYDQRRIMHRKVKPNPAMFVQNAVVRIPLCAENADLWIENSHPYRIRFTISVVSCTVK
ncbi:hypothetical protein E7X23_26390, partial [Bacteroides fragilis]